MRLCHWAFALALGALIGSGLEVFAAFPAFGEKIPQADLFVPPSALRLGGWLGGALQWHFTFAWLLTAAMVIYLAYQIVSRNGQTGAVRRSRSARRLADGAALSSVRPEADGDRDL